MKKSTILFAILFLCFIGEAQVYPTIHSNRPRIYVDSARFAYLHNNMSIGDCGTTYNDFNNAVFGNWYNDNRRS